MTINKKLAFKLSLLHNKKKTGGFLVIERTSIQGFNGKYQDIILQHISSARLFRLRVFDYEFPERVELEEVKQLATIKYIYQILGDSHKS